MTDANKIESIGERLHRARLKKKASIEDAYKETKIHIKVLTALEEDRHEEFLSPVYVKAFLKSYCRYLEIDCNKIMSDYDLSVKSEPQKAPVNLDIEPKASLNKNLSASSAASIEYMESIKKWMIPAGVVMLGAAAALMFIFIASKAIGKLNSARLFSKGPVAAEARTEQHRAVMKKSLSIPADQPLKLTIKAKEKVWLQVKADGKTVFENVLKKNNVESYDADDKFQIWTGKGEFIELMLNSSPLGSPGKGVLKNITLTREGLAVEK